MASDLVIITGTAAAILTVSRGVAQVIRAIRVSSTGVSLTTWVLSMFNSKFWTAYGVNEHLVPQIAANIPTAIQSWDADESQHGFSIVLDSEGVDMYTHRGANTI